MSCSLAPPFSYSYIEEKTSCLVFLHRPIVDALLTLIWHPPFTRRCCANTSATFPSQPKAVLLQHNCMPDVCCVRKIFIVQLPLSDVGGDCTFAGGGPFQLCLTITARLAGCWSMGKQFEKIQNYPRFAFEKLVLHAFEKQLLQMQKNFLMVWLFVFIVMVLKPQTFLT